MSFPKINFEERRPSTFWQDISKDIFSPFAPSNKTLLVHLANLSKKTSNSQTPLKIHPLTEKKQKNIPKKLKTYHEILTKKKKTSISMQIEEDLGYVISAETLPVLNKVKHYINYIKQVESFKQEYKRAPLS